MHHAAEVFVQEQVFEFRVAVIGVLDILQETCADNAAPAENHRNAAIAQVPVILIRSHSHLGKALGVGGDFARIQRFADRFDELLGIAVIAFDFRTLQAFACSHTFFLHG
ncbi:hypothetical protein D3C87_1660730 [compost metagenome]